MPVTAFQPMARIFLTAFRDRAAPTVLWIRHENPVPVAIVAIFNSEFAPVDVDGNVIGDVRPTAHVALVDAQRLAPGRPLKALFDNRDFIIASGVSYAVESCTPDGQTMVEVELKK